MSHPTGSPQDHQAYGAQTGAPHYGTPHPAGGLPHGSPWQTSPYGAVETGPNDRSMAVLAHLSMIVASLLSAGTLAILGPLVMWLIYKDKSPFVRQASAGAFNFAIWTMILGIVGWVATVTVIGAIVGIPILILTGILSVVFPIIGAVRANRGEVYRYPLTPDFLR